MELNPKFAELRFDAFWIVMGINVLVWILVSFFISSLETDSTYELKKLKKRLDKGSITSCEFQKRTLDILSKLELESIHKLMKIKRTLDEGSITSDEFGEKAVEILLKT